MASGGNVDVEKDIALSEEDISKIDGYFDLNARIYVHKEMLKDRVRTQAYRDAILNNRHLFSGKTVLNLGCGTGILSMFAAKAGASRVIGVDASDIIKHARTIIRDNGFEDVITLIQGDIEEVELPDGIDQVDIIVVFDWIGCSLFYEGMLDSVLFARNKWLKPDGLMFPDKVTLFLVGITAIELERFRTDFRDDAWGTNTGVFGNVPRREPFKVDVDPEHILTHTTHLIKLDLKSLTKEDANFSIPFVLQVTQKDFLNAVATFFDVEFTATYTGVKFSTSPNGPGTQWKPTVFLTDEIIPVRVGDTIRGQFDLRRNPRQKRKLDITIMFDVDGIIIVHEKENDPWSKMP